MLRHICGCAVILLSSASAFAQTPQTLTADDSHGDSGAGQRLSPGP
jgi:hypothetical protein